MRQTKALPKPGILWDLFELQVLTGNLIWKKNPFRKRVGTIAGGLTTSGSGYKRVGIYGERYSLHRLVYKWATGKEPGAVVEHKYDDPLDNRPWMLIDSSHRGNQDTRQNLSGKLARGVCLRDGKYGSSIFIEGHLYHLGTFGTEEKASKAYQVALQNFTKDPSWRPKLFSSSSKYRGVHLAKHFQPPKWVAQVRVNGKTIHVGSFDNEDSAGAAAEVARKKYLIN